jgi:D-glycero-alpha-D-manno-heptose-7-phosphate kinase
MADIPAGTGLGSSGSFTTALLKALHTHQRQLIHPRELAEQACHIEIDLLNEPIGKQDQYIAAYGGVTCFRFETSGHVEVWPLRMTQETRNNLEDSLIMFFTGFSRSAGSILRDQDSRTKVADPAMIDNLHHVKELGFRSQQALEAGNLDEFGRIMHEHWLYKRQRTPGMSNPQIDEWYDVAIRNGATGGKLIGAGGGGFLLFHTNDKRRVRHALLEKGLREVRFRFDFEGTKVVVQ